MGTRHDRGKAERRRQILHATITILNEEGEEGLTIRAIAARAEISPVTVYNLFGSKCAVIRAAIEEDFWNLIAYFEANASEDSLTRIFDLTDLGADYCQRRPKFYKSLFGSLLGNSKSELAVETREWRSAYMCRLLASAVDAGMLRKSTPVDALSTVFLRLGRSITQEWLDDCLTFVQGREEVIASYSVILREFITKRGAATLSRILEQRPNSLSVKT